AREGGGAPVSRRSSRDETGMGVLDGDQLHVRHGDEVEEVGGVVERVPVAYLDRGDADRQSRRAAVSCRTLACYPSDGPAAPPPIQNISGLPQGLEGRPAAG